MNRSRLQSWNAGSLKMDANKPGSKMTMTLDELKEAVADICAGCDSERSQFTNADLGDAIDAAIRERDKLRKTLAELLRSFEVRKTFAELLRSFEESSHERSHRN